MPEFRKKPVVVEAEQFFPDQKPWPEGVVQYEKKRAESLDGTTNTWYGWRIETLEGPHLVTPGDWIIVGVRGERHPCKPDIFEAAYEPAQLAAPAGEYDLRAAFRAGVSRGIASHGNFKQIHPSEDEWVAARALRPAEGVNERERSAATALLEILTNSRGVVGWHRNGDEALWSEWADYDDMIALAARLAPQPPQGQEGRDAE